MSKIYLKVKITSLAAEARIIRNLEKNRRLRLTKRHKPLDDVWWGLNAHRRFEVRKEARCAHLAYGYLRDKAYRDIENDPHWLKPPFSKTNPDWDRIAAIVRKFGTPTDNQGDRLYSRDQAVDTKNKLIEWAKVPA